MGRKQKRYAIPKGSDLFEEAILKISFVDSRTNNFVFPDLEEDDKVKVEDDDDLESLMNQMAGL